jgi:hypothetical protein
MGVALGVALGLWLPLMTAAQAMAPSQLNELEQGRHIYNDGMLPSGALLQGTRAGQVPVSGDSAACVNCHRRSGMGQVESEILMPPITGRFLFATRGDKRVATMDPHVSKHFNPAHDPYTDETLAAAIRDGINSQGRKMNAVMPHFILSDSELKALVVYLKQLSADWSPGVSQDSIRFATVITPDVDPVRRKVMIDMMQAIFRQKNGSTLPATLQHTRHHMTTAAELILGTERKWELEIWELQGAPESWGEQLAARYRDHPVFALVSGVSHSTWQPVHDFCDKKHVPCWFPSVDVPGKEQSPYAFYFSGGVTLESAVLARYLMDQKASPNHLVQVYRDDEVGRAAAHSLTQALTGSGIAVTDRVLSTDMAAFDSLREALGTVNNDDVLIAWLRPDDIRALVNIKPISDKNYFSATLAMGEYAPLPEDWRVHSHWVYLYELPENRTKNLYYFYAWLNINNLPLVDEAMQSEAFFALNFMTDTLSEMLDNVYRDYLVDRAESMLSIREGLKTEQETRDRVALGREGDLKRKRGASTIAESARIKISSQYDNADKSKGTTLYPHLSLGPDQRFASKSGYIVRFASERGNKLIAESELIVP